jgi:hypothetical protein
VSRLVRVSPSPLDGSEAARRGYLVRGTITPVFISAHALAPEDAIDFSPRNPREARAWETLKRAGLVRQAGGKWWLDIVAYQARERARSRAAVPWLIGGSLAAAAAATLFYQG